jgi:uncharacterized protein (TIGR00730 family)
MQINSMAVFCGSKSGSNPLFTEHAKQLGRLIAEENIVLIYGGGNRGLMGTMANAVLENNGKVIGIIPQVLNEWEHQHEGISELIVVENMHIRKRLLYEKCDAAIILPGGYGTLDEVFEMLTWNQLSIHNKKIFFLNTDGFYDHLMQHIRLMMQEEFLYGDPDEKITMLHQAEELLPFL